ncbi:MAG: hypothetical protein DRQ47_07795 [Gammaproteobacteria bacterium]|nr:MAG: hypothetical protein DRQ47_07795 [Gammaproteobacteria bacterium]
MMRLSTLSAAISLMALGLFQNIYLWFPIRFILGASAAVLWSASEALINELVDDKWRGRIIGIYGSAGAAGFALGPMILITTGTEGLMPFVVTTLLILLAGLPLIGLQDHRHSSEQDDHVNLRKVFRLLPHIMLLNLTYAAALESFVAFFPLFGINIGLSGAHSLSLLTTFAIGGVLLQMPLGWLADKVNKQMLLLACVLFTLVGFVILPQVIQAAISGPIFIFTLGGVEGMVYTMGVIVLGQRFRGAELASASVLYTGMWGLGTMIGPVLTGAGMDLFGTSSMPYILAVFYACYLPAFFLLRSRGNINPV